MIIRAPISEVVAGAIGPVRCDTFKADNLKVWEIIMGVTKDKKRWEHVKEAKKDRDGRCAYKFLHNHYLGIHQLAHQAAQAEAKLDKLSYNGEKKNWKFEDYATAHQKVYNILEELKEKSAHNGMDESTRLRRLLQGIKANDLEVPKATIFASREISSDFARAVNLFKDYIRQRDANSGVRTFNVSQVSTKKGGQPGGKPKGSGKKNKKGVSADEVEDRYYTPAEYKTLSSDARAKLAKMREARG